MVTPIFVISLRSSSDRRKHIEKEFLKKDLVFNWIDAVDGNSLSEEEVNKVYDDEVCNVLYGRSLGRGEIGCYLSHLEAYRRIINDGLSYALIFEDDIFLNNNIINFINSISSIPNNIEMITLANYPNTSKLRKAINIACGFKLREHVSGIWGTYGYYITNIGAQKICNQSKKIFTPIDHIGRAIGRKINIKTIHPYCLSTEVDRISGCLLIPSMLEDERRKLENGEYLYRPSLKEKIKILIKRIL